MDIGCGQTSVLNILPYCKKYGIDIVIEDLKRNKFPLDDKIKWINSEAEKLPFEEKKFDIIFCSNGIDHYEHPKKVISEIKRVLKKQGLVILTVDVFDQEKGYRDEQHPHSYTKTKVLNELNGFNILFEKISPIRAQFFRFINNHLIFNDDQKELILVMRLDTKNLYYININDVK